MAAQLHWGGGGVWGGVMLTRQAAAVVPLALAPPPPSARAVGGAGGARGVAVSSLAGPPLVYHPLYSAPQLPPTHRFPMVRSGRLSGVWGHARSS